MSKKENIKHNELENVEQALGTTEAFIEKYQKQILIGVSVVVLIVLSILAFRNFYMQPREIEAQNEMSKAQQYFAVDSFRIALNGNINSVGFQEIASDYSMTSSGKLATAYAGICYYKLGDYKNAIKFLSQYSGDDNYLSISTVGLIGDAYVQLGQTSEAIEYFKKAADEDNDVLTPLYLKKEGVVYESINQPDKALALFKEIKEKYPKSAEATDIDKYIERISK